MPAFAALTPLLGRDDDLARVAQALAHPTQGGFVTITGAGGSGKTLLARHVAARSGLVDGRAPVWVDLLEVNRPDAVVPAVALAAQVPGPPRQALKLAQALRDARLLLVLDNAEHVLQAVADLTAVLRREAPGVRLLVTSQAPLHGAGETVHALRGLSVPPAPCSAAEALRHAAVALFVAQARQADRRFRLEDAQVEDVAAICASLGGSALGVQLAAALLGQMPLAAVRSRLARAHTGPEEAAVDPAANVLRSALSWSHDLLGPAAQRVFRRLAIAQGPLPLALVQGLAADSEEPDAIDAVTTALADLVDRSLVQCAPAPDAAPEDAPRYRLLEAPRALALEQLAAAGERALVLARLARALAPLGDQWHAALWRGERPPPDEPALRAAMPGPADIAAAFEAALQAPGLASATVLARMCCLVHTIAKRHPVAERLRWAQAASERADEAGLSAALQGRLLLTATTLVRHSDWGAKLAMLQRSVAAWHNAGDLAGELRALASLAETHAFAGRLAEAEAVLQRVRELDDPASPPGRQRLRWYAEGLVAGSAGDLPRAITAWREHLRLARQYGESELELVRALHSLAHDELLSGEAAAALPRLQQAVEMARRQADREALHAYLLPSLVAARLALGDLPGARAAAAEGWPQARGLDADAWWADHLALLAWQEGRPRTAARLLGLADAAYTRQNDTRQALETRVVSAVEAALRAALGEALHTALRAEGRAQDAAPAVFAAALALADGPALLTSAAPQ
ncbi:hypothetical protein EOE66_18890 [Rubrivivax rivuli]|uniref:AAA+ ATPase domain-containing protein n=1 Tax=Rubrivivax rivuli TaxID=1862385 RepID=A0A437RAH5_9BURK|nr:hypothetical protein EOE66_18890 [Rubrivivax rivuli]